MATAGDLVRSALRKAGVIASGETPSAAEMADSLDVLNDILEEWSNDGFMIFEKKIETFPLVHGQSMFTIGVGGDFNTSRPMEIFEANTKSSEGIELPLRIWNHQEWAQITLKNMQGDRPEGMYYNPNFPFGEINLWPLPSNSHSIVLTSQKPLSSVIQSTVLTYPPGYNKALKLTLAAELKQEFGLPSDGRVEESAIKARAAIKRTNTSAVLLGNDAFGLNESRWRGRRSIYG